MTVTDALHQQLQTVMRPVAQANGLPNHFYIAPEGLALERDRLFFAGWACIGLTKDVPQKGDVLPCELLGAPLLLVRDHDNTIRVYQNVCRHRGMILVSQPTNFAGVIRCPYHSWCYSLDGKLRATPHVGGPGINKHASVTPETTGLIDVRCGVFMDMVFINLDGKAPDFDTFSKPYQKLWADFCDQPLFHGGADSSFTLPVNCNWKLAVENYLESYHLPWVHPGLNAYSRLEDHYHIESPDQYSGQGTVVYNPKLSETQSFPNFAGLPKKWDKSAEYIGMFPNVLLGVHRDHFYAIRLEPLDYGITLEHVDLYYASEEAASSDGYKNLRQSNAALWKSIFLEDIGVVEGMQKGRHAPGFDGGRFSAVMDSPTHLFHTWVAKRLVE